MLFGGFSESNMVKNVHFYHTEGEGRFEGKGELEKGDFF